MNFRRINSNYRSLKRLVTILTVYNMLRFVNLQRVVNVTRTNNADKIVFNGNCTDICVRINAYSSSSTCECTCQYGLSYMISEGKCVSISQRKSFVLSNLTSPNFRVSELEQEDLLTGVKLQYCENQCTQNTGDCRLKREGSQVDRKTWTQLWKNVEDVNFAIIKTGDNNVLKIVENNIAYKGLLLRLSISCILPNNSPIDSHVIISMSGTFQVLEEPSSSVLPNTLPIMTSLSFTHITVLPTVFRESITNSKMSTVSETEELSTDVLLKYITLSSTNTPTPSSSKNATVSPSPTDKQRPTDHSILKSSGNNNLLLIIIIPVGIAALITVIYVTLLCCRTKKKRNANKRSCDPVSLFQATTPIFLVNGDRVKAARSLDMPSSLLGASLYEIPLGEKKSASVSHLYAQIDKFLKKKKRSASVDGSFDDGYNTDDNYDHAMFAAFPPELYSFPDSIISLNEPDYKIPEDIDEKNVIQNYKEENKCDKKRKTQRKSLKDFSRSMKRLSEIDFISLEGDDDKTYETPEDL